MYSESRKRKRLLDRLIDTRHHEDRSAAAAARRGLRLRFVTFNYPLLSLHKFLLLRLVKNSHFPNERSAPVADLVRVHGVLASSLVLSRRVMLLFFFFFGFGIRSFSRIFSRRLIRRGRLVGAVPSENFFSLFFFFEPREFALIRSPTSVLCSSTLRPRILVSLVETSTTTSGAFKRELAVVDHARVTSRSFARHSRSFLLRLSTRSSLLSRL